MKRILIPTDFSDNAWRACTYAANLYRKEPCHYILLHTYHAPATDTDMVASGTLDTLVRNSEIEMEKLLVRFKDLDHHPETTSEIRTEYGLVTMVAAMLDKNGEIDIIIMGTKGAGGIQEVVFGSTASSVISKTKCPVICVPVNSELKVPRHILFASDYHELKKSDELDEMLHIARNFNAIVSILNVRNSDKEPVSVEEAVEGLALHYKMEGITHEYYNIESEDVETAILDFAHQHDVDLIVAIRHHYGLVKRIFHKSLSKSLAFHSDIPLLTLKEG